MFEIRTRAGNFQMTGGSDDEMRKAAQRITRHYSRGVTSEYMDADEFAQMRRSCKARGWSLVNPDEAPQDFDSGMGIGGINRIEETIPQPSSKTYQAQMQRINTARKCRKCGSTELEGAMFTTLPSSGLCDDCV